MKRETINVKSRRPDWSRRLGRLRLDAEPLADQLDRLRRVTWTLTIVALVIGSIFLALFSAFEAPLVGLIVSGVLVVPVVSLAWFDFKRLSKAVEKYEQESRN